MQNCCKAGNKTKKCRRSIDGKIFKLPRRFSRKRCLRGIRGFTMRSSCAPYKGCNKRGGRRKTQRKSRKPNHRAIAVIDMNGVKGTVTFRSIKDGRCSIRFDISGLSSGLHGFHVHKCGDLSRGCESACQHFNPDNQVHGGRHSRQRHAGDLGNIKSKNGVAKGSMIVKNLSCNPCSKYSLIGRMIIVHADEDDLGKGGDEESLKTGNAGKRLACGVIGIM